MTHRKNLGLGLGKGYKNLIPKDPFVHSMSARGVRTYVEKLFPSGDLLLTNDKGKKMRYSGYSKRDALKKFKTLNAKGDDKTILHIEPTYVPRGRGNNPDAGARDLKYKIREWGYIFSTYQDAKKYADEHTSVNGVIIENKKLNAKGNVSSVENLEKKKPYLQLVTQDTDVQAIKDYLGKKAEDYDSFLVKVGDGDYDEVWGMEGNVPYLNKTAYRLMAKGKSVKVYDNGTDYTIVIGKNVYEMSNDAMMPNGVNIYLGEIDEFPDKHFGKEVKQIPEQVKRAIKDREPETELMAKGKKPLTFWQKIGVEDKPHRGRPEKQYKTKLLFGWNIDPQDINRKNIARIMKTKKKGDYPYTKREKAIGFGTLAGAGAGYSLGLLAGGLGGMFIGVPAGILAGNIITRNIIKERGRKPAYQVPFYRRLLNPREDILAERERVNKIERARVKTAKIYGLSAKGKKKMTLKKNSNWRLVSNFTG